MPLDQKDNSADLAGRNRGSEVVVISANSSWNIANFRVGLIRGLQAAGYRVVALAPLDKHAARVRALGCELIDLPFDPKGMNPFREFALFQRYRRELQNIQPVAFLGFTIKPNVYGSLAARSLGIPVVNNVAGLGTAFLRSGWLNWIARILYRAALRRSHRVFFQNEDDMALFVDSGLVDADRTELLPGSGVDLKHFVPAASAARRSHPPVILMSARLLWDKGVGEFVEAVKLVTARGIACDARLLGFLDVANPSAIPRDSVERWQREGILTYLGEVEDVRPMLSEADVVVLPSYREGTPRSLLEAAAMGKPIITTYAPGCRDVVRYGVNGYLVPVRDAHALADALARFIALSTEACEIMGRESRSLVEDRYDERIVIDAYLRELSDLNRGSAANA